MVKRSRLSKLEKPIRIGKLWGHVVRGSRIRFDKPHAYVGLDGSREVVYGDYYISGFWGNAVGLNRSSAAGLNEVVAPSKSLTKAILLKGRVES